MFELLDLLFMNDNWVHGALEEAKNCFQASSGELQTVSSTQVYIQQTLLLILEDISSSAINSVMEKVSFWVLAFSIFEMHSGFLVSDN